MHEIWSEIEEAARLKQRFVDAKARGISQAQFAREYSVPGGASMLNQHLSGNRPISLEAARAYAKGFGCSLGEISPRLEAEVNPVQPDRKMAPVAYSEPTPWARKLALVFDMIPEDDYEKRSKAYLLSTDAIAAVLQGDVVTLVREPHQKK